ncbi:McrC family protein [Treponema sp. OttesenSCG-928-L16]|nr:McrC family protein [Treponema sp. OttesenSCG-928-L16]
MNNHPDPVIETLKEHVSISNLDDIYNIRYKKQPEDGDITQVWAFGLQPGGKLGYYIGLDWVDKKEPLVFYVTPKIEGLDYYRMFAECLESPKTRPFMDSVYDIRFEKPFIKPPAENCCDILSFLMYHYILVLSKVMQKPLMKGYVSYQENLRAKVKGKIVLSSHLQHNVFGMRPDRMMCRYDEFSRDCVENRLLHSAYHICRSYLTRVHGSRRFLRIVNFGTIDHVFSDIGFIGNVQELHRIRCNPLYRDYSEALRLAMLIYRYHFYHETQEQDSIHRRIPPYIIDMSKLFELYVLLQISKAGIDVNYQPKGKYGAADFIDAKNKVIIDAKYKTTYSTHYNIDDIRQVSGYARDKALLKIMGLESDDEKDIVRNCLIVYPDVSALPDFPVTYLEMMEPITQFHRIFQLGIHLPVQGAT